MGELWAMLDSAQNSPSGIPEEMLEKKKEEIRSRKVRGTRFYDCLLCVGE